ncbi:hypothetical protein Psuf_061740 [Phytohabitans suffuscus]|uniref:Uncharacterized protein n=1 Tax=Phytohabitans suffuscus TaxID=624315 RepID=A0A6F8YSQ1_9ACTN|nr:hypothetical protein Psuf_061740 [Phytohabitans suffuscus]
MASRPINENANSRYDDDTSGGVLQNIPKVAPDIRPAVKHRRRAVPDAQLTLEVTYVSGPEAKSLARTQYEAIWEVLEWLHTNQPPHQQAA